MKTALAALAACAVLLLVLVGLARDRESRREQPDDIAERLDHLFEVAQSLSLPSKPQAVRFGEEARIGFLVATVHAPEKTSRLWASLLVCRNEGKHPAGLFSIEFVAKDEEGAVLDSYWDFDSGLREFDWNPIPPGGQRRGYVGFELADDAIPDRVLYGCTMEPYLVCWSEVGRVHALQRAEVEGRNN